MLPLTAACCIRLPSEAQALLQSALEARAADVIGFSRPQEQSFDFRGPAEQPAELEIRKYSRVLSCDL